MFPCIVNFKKTTAQTVEQEFDEAIQQMQIAFLDSFSFTRKMAFFTLQALKQSSREAGAERATGAKRRVCDTT